MDTKTKFIVEQRKLDFAAWVATGLSPAQAAGKVGVSAVTGNEYMRDPVVMNYLKAIYEDERKKKVMTREKVQDIILEAVDIARLVVDPNAMVRAAGELNKMNGYYAPEKVDVNLNTNQRRLKDQFDHMDDDELLKVIEGEFTEVETDDATDV